MTLLNIFEEHADVLSPLFNASGTGAETEDAGMPLWAIILIACGGVAVIGGTMTVVLLAKKKRKRAA